MTVPVALGLVGASAAPVGTVTSAEFKAWKPSGTALLLAEDFNGADGTTLDGTTTDHTGQTWTRWNGVWTIQGNAARSDTNSSSSLHAPTGTMHHAIEAKVTVYTWLDTGIFVNGDSGRNYGMVLAYTHAAGGRLALWVRRTGGPAGDWLVDSVGGLGTTGTHTLRLESGPDNVIRGYFDGVLRIEHALSGSDITLLKQSAQNYVGTWAWGDSTTTFDEIHADRMMSG